jgi:TolB-like protein
MGAKENLPELVITDQLNRILASNAFKNSRVLSGFLKFVTEETLAGREQEIKEYNIGIQVLCRNFDFNPQIDSIVRIHAGRLRRALKEYYYGEGKQDPVWIEIPKGSYIPVFLPPGSFANSENSHPVIQEKIKQSTKKPTVAVLPFRNISESPTRDFFADGLGDLLSTELTWFQDLTVISYYSSRYVSGLTSDIKESARLLEVQYLIAGSTQSDGNRISIRVQLILGVNSQQLWAQSFERDNTASGLYEIQHEIVRSILAAIGGYYGVIFREEYKSTHSDRINGPKMYDAIFWYYYYQKVHSKEAMESAICALENTVKKDPDYAVAWAMLGELYLDEKAYEFKRFENPIEKGLECALRAIHIDPACQHGYQTLAWAYLFTHNKEEFLKAADQCLAINPNASDTGCAIGFGFVCAGEFERGYKLLGDSIQNNPYCPWWCNTTFAFYFFIKKQFEEALHWAEKVNAPDLIWDPLMKASAFGHLNCLNEADKNIQLLLNLLPEAAAQIKDILGSFLLSPELNCIILEGLMKAGLAINTTHAAAELPEIQ